MLIQDGKEITSLAGTPGLRGEIGEPGVKGEKGNAGQIGDTGEKGNLSSSLVLKS